MSDIRAQLEAAAHEVARLARGADAAQLHDPTPCPDYDVTVLLAHLMQEMVLHGWDLAAATGQTARFADDVSATVLGRLDDERDAMGGDDWYGPQVSTSSPSLLDRAVAASGRDPGWSPPASSSSWSLS